jgi:hypothetical protein
MSPEEKKLQDILKLLGQSKSEIEEWYNVQSKINSGLESYIDGIREVGELNDDIKTITKQINKIQKEGGKLSKEKIAFLEIERAKIIKNRDLLKEAIKDANKFSMASTAAFAGAIKGMASLNKVPNFITGKLGMLKGLFEMDKAIRTTITQMGSLGKQSDIVRQNIKSAAVNTQSFGVGIKEIAEIQAQYTETLGRNVILSQKSLESIAEMGKSTGLGLEGATEMATQFDKMGVSADKTGEFIQEALDNSSAMGLNATKVMKNINQNFNMLNKYRFKDGIKGLIKMGQLSTKLGIEMEFASGMADKLWDVEGAVEMSAQLNVMGGAWAQLADPFKLMYMARNDMEGLTENIANAAASSMSFAKDGSIQTNAMEMHRLKIIAEKTGLEYEKLVELGKTQFKMGKIEMQSSGLPDDVKEFVANTAEFKDGKAYIQVESGKKLLSQLNAADRDFLKTQVAEKEIMKKRAEEAQSFDEKFQNLINMVQITMMPIVEGLTEALDPLVKDLMNGDFKKDLVALGKNIGDFVNWAAKGVGSFVKTVVDIFGAKGLFITYLVGKTAMWIASGLALATGFRMGTSGMFGGMGGKGGGTPAGPLTKSGKPDMRYASNAGRQSMSVGDKLMGKNVLGGKLAMGTMGSMAAGAGLGLAGYGTDKLRESIYGEGSKEGKGLGVASAALKGAGMGMMFGPWGALAGGLIGGGIGVYDEYFSEPQSDVKFPKLGPNHSKGRMLMQGGKITPIDNKDELLAMKPGGVVDKTFNNTNAGVSAIKIEFGELHITGDLNVKIPGGSQIGQELIKSSEFKSSITRIVTSQIEKNVNGKSSDRKN